jgi:hypothetical protein
VVERRAAERTTIDVSLTCRMPASPTRAIIRDVSHHGCKIEVPGTLMELGGTALLELPGMAHIPGQIVWTRGKTAGIRFERRLGTSAAVALGLEQAQPVEVMVEIDYPQPGAGMLRHWFRRLAGVFA